MLRHRLGLAGRANAELAAAIVVHGFDIPLKRPDAFEVAVANGRDVLAGFGVPVTRVETNLKEIVGRWEYEYAAAVASVLHQFHTIANVGLLATGGEHPHSPVIPFGSNPITDRLMSSGHFELEPDGAVTRTEKVALIAKFPEVRDRLRVCWEGPKTGRNCGRCEKCRRTYLNFLAAGTDPGAFLDGIDLKRLTKIRARNTMQLEHLRDILVAAKSNGIKAPWVRSLRRTVRAQRLSFMLQDLLGT